MHFLKELMLTCLIHPTLFKKNKKLHMIEELYSWGEKNVFLFGSKHSNEEKNVLFICEKITHKG